jgi:threonine dehydratase
MIPLAEVRAARARIASHLRPVVLTHDRELDLWIAWENQQVTGSFKPRGALNAVLAGPAAERPSRFITASAGNHGQGLALAGRSVGVPVTIYASADASPRKIAGMRDLGAEVRLMPGGYAAAEGAALAAARQGEGRYVSPYNDPRVMAGGGTLALEILEQVPARSFLVAAGGGGLIGGIGSVAKQVPPAIHVVGVQSVASSFLHAEFHTRDMSQVVETPSIADGLAGAVEPGSETVPILHEVTDDFQLVSEDEIVAAMAYAHARHRQMLEGAGAVAIAAVLASRAGSLPRPAVAIASGGNIDPERFRAVLAAC